MKPVLLILVAAICAFAADISIEDVTLKTRTLEGGKLWHTDTVYVGRQRQRRESWFEARGGVPGPQWATIFQCDQQQRIALDLRAHTYALHLIPSPEQRVRNIELREREREAKGDDPGAGTVTITVHTIDTGERQEFGGLIARRIKQLRTQERRPDTPVGVTPRIERDGWYVDLPLGCAGGAASGSLVAQSFVFSYVRPHDVAQPRINIKRTGDEQGLRGTVPIFETVTTTDEDGGQSTTVTELVDISRAPIDPRVFEVPAGFAPAQRLPHGGFDMGRPASVTGTLMAYCKQFWYDTIRLLNR